MNHNINSEDYWEKRFSQGDWDKYDGGKQSVFFAKVAAENWPNFITDEFTHNKLTIRDIGCAEGDGTAYWAHSFPSCRFIGQDISRTAIDIASSKFSCCTFEIGDIYTSIGNADVIISSNTLEHLAMPDTVLCNMCRACKKYVILIVPFQDDSGILEHINYFDYNSFPLEIENCYLEAFRVVDCKPLNSPYWNGKQMVIVYTNRNYRPNGVLLGDYLDEVFEQFDKEKSELMLKISLTEKKSESDRAIYENQISSFQEKSLIISNNYEKEISELQRKALEMSNEYNNEILRIQESKSS